MAVDAVGLGDLGFARQLFTGGKAAVGNAALDAVGNLPPQRHAGGGVLHAHGEAGERHRENHSLVTKQSWRFVIKLSSIIDNLIPARTEFGKAYMAAGGDIGKQASAPGGDGGAGAFGCRRYRRPSRRHRRAALRGYARAGERPRHGARPHRRRRRAIQSRRGHGVAGGGPACDRRGRVLATRSAATGRRRG